MKRQILRILAILMMAMTVSVSTAQFQKSEWDDDLTHFLPSCHNLEDAALATKYLYWKQSVLRVLSPYVEWMNEVEGDINIVTIETYFAFRYIPEQLHLHIPPCFEAYRFHYMTQRLMADYLLAYILAHNGYAAETSIVVDNWNRSYRVIAEDVPVSDFSLFPPETQR